MKGTICAAAATAAVQLLAILAPGVEAAVSLDFVKTRRDGSQLNPRDASVLDSRFQRSRRRKRDDKNVLVTLDNSAVLYSANVSVGTPGQQLILQLDTGSSDIWIPSSDAEICQESNQCQGGTFDSSQSSTFKDVSEDGFKIEYVDGSSSKGDYITDVFAIGGATLDSLEMGLATTSSIGVGVMGIGYDNNEGIVLYSGKPAYRNLIDKMLDDGLVSARAYSLWLNDLDANTGSILFGAVDTEKYQGDLIGVPILPDATTGNFSSFSVTLSNIAVNTGKSTSNITSSGFAVPIILDAGTSLTYLPDDITSTIWDAVGATESDTDGVGYVDCSKKNTDATIDFQFGGSDGPMIKTPISEMIFDQSMYFSDGTPACAFGILPAGQDELLFGDSFLRTTYVVYDLDTNVCYLANTVFDSDKSNVKEITKGASGVPAVSVTASQVVASQTYTGVIGAVTGAITVTSTSSSFVPGQGTIQISGAAAAGRIAPIDSFSNFLIVGLVSIVMMSFGAGRVLYL